MWETFKFNFVYTQSEIIKIVLIKDENENNI